MEVLALAGLLGVGYVLTSTGKRDKNEGFESQGQDEGSPLASAPPFLPMGGQPAPLYEQDRTPPGHFTITPATAGGVESGAIANVTVPGKPRLPRREADGNLDLFYNLPSGGSLPSEALTQPDLYERNLTFSAPAPSLTPPAPLRDVTAQVRMNTGDYESPPVYNSGKTIVSALTGLPMTAEEFSHNNMTPFFRGAPKQNMRDDANQQRLDNMVGSGYTQISKREQAPLFNPTKEPMGNVTGLESFTDFAQDRVIVPTNRAFERPVDPVHVGPGLDQGYSALGIGGFQQFETLEIARQRLSVDDLRYDSNPKVSYELPFVAGKAINSMPAQIGEVRHYHPDKFHLNEHGERNFASVGENSKPTERAGQVMKHQQRTETTTEYAGVAQAADFTATYSVPSFRAPFATQLDGYGFRNADGSGYGVSNTDATNNDFGRSGVELPVTQRNVTAERTQGLNVTAANGPKAMTVYDPNDTARTTVRETTGAYDYVGIGAPASAPTKLTVYDPTDIVRTTTRNTLAEPDHALNVSRAGVPGALTLGLQDPVRLTTKEQLTAHSAYDGIAGPAVEKALPSYVSAYNMRQNPNKEVVASGRRPIAGNGQLISGIFNGQDNVNLSYRKLESDWINDRENTVTRVVGPAAGPEEMGLQRPKNVLRMDISRDRNIHEILDTLNDNPYALPIHRIAAGLAGPAEMAAATANGGYIYN